MFDNKVDITKIYGATYVEKDEPVKSGKLVKSIDKKTIPSRRAYSKLSHQTYTAYQELRKTDKFKMWWKKQFARQEGLCYYCEIGLKSVVINVEHITPMSAGGSNKPKNMVLACEECNKNKGSRVLPNKERKELRKRLDIRIQANKRAYKMLQEYTTEELEQELYWRNNL